MRFAAVVLILGSTIGAPGRVASAEPRAVAEALVTDAAGAPSPGSARVSAMAPASAPGPRVAPARTTPRMSDEAELAQVVNLYEAGKYQQCAENLSRLLNPRAAEPLREPEIIATARIYHAACLIGSGRPDDANAPLRAAILADPQMKPPDSLVFPPPVVEQFLRVRETLHREIRRSELERVEIARKEAEDRALRAREKDARVLALEELASQEVITVRNRRWIALIPFGVGQFQNGNTELGWVFLASEVALGATALTSLAMQTHFTLEAQRLKNPNNNAVLETWNTLLDVSAWGFVGVAALGIAQAQLAFVPETREVRRRPIPPRLRRTTDSSVRVTPTLRASETSWSLGLAGTF